jgi:hypothetical protein
MILAWHSRSVGRMAELLLIKHMTREEDLAAKEMIRTSSSPCARR